LLGLDAREGKVATQGWLETSDVVARSLAEQFDRLPLAGIIYTDIARDGTMEGPNLEATRALAERVKTPVFASGGVGSLADLERLAGLPIAGCIVGRALYEGRFTLTEALLRLEAVSPCSKSN
jgi:phosphoribosylformimino-5-aminoimidazole carboxamide ribotide isomerase